jgi:hypothetical protein
VALGAVVKGTEDLSVVEGFGIMLRIAMFVV